MKINVKKENRKALTELKNVVLLILTIIDLIFIFLTSVYSFNFRIDYILADYDFLVCVLLFIDLSYDFYTSNKDFKEYFIKDKQILSLLSLLPFDLIFRYFAIFRLFRFLKIIKMVRVWHIIGDIDSLIYLIQNHLLKVLFAILVLYVTISSSLLILLDNSVNNFQDALWFIVVTISTVGYGDITPVSTIGKSLAIFTIIIGTIVVAIFTAYLSALYNQKPEMETRSTFIKHIKKFEKRNNDLKNEVNRLNEKLSDVTEENRKLNEKLDMINEKIDKISK